MQMKLGKLLAETKTGEKDRLSLKKMEEDKSMNLNWQGIIFLKTW